MCGIVGYIGTCQAAPVLLDGLSKLEYRGYDSAGIAVYDGNKIQMQKAMGRLKVLEEMTQNGATLPGTVGIGHTRWATHGAPSDLNAHPHFNKDHSIVVVHNGIIENYLKLKKKLMSKGYEFLSETDTEVIAHMLDYYYNGDPLATITKVMHRMEGSYALGILFRDYPDEVYAVRKDSPLIVGTSKSGNLIASDVPAVLKYTRDVYFLENEEIVKLTRDGLHFYNIDEEELEKEATHIDWDMNAAEKGGYEHFMLKEMHEQPKAVKDTLTPRIKNGDVVIEELGMTDEEIRAIRKIFIVACGSAYHTGVTSKYIFEKLARIPVEVDLASEFRYRDPILPENTLVVIVSQSGETADTLAALRLAKEKGVRTLGIVNVVGSSIAREADNVMYTWAGPEIAVATTKAYSTQLIAQYLLAMKYAAGELKHGTISLIEDGRLVVAVLTQPELYKKTISNIQEVKTRGAFVMAVTTVGNTEVEKVADYVVYLPETNPIFANSLAIIPLQLFGYYVSIGRGLDVDKPRNLAKSVTVE